MSINVTVCAASDSSRQVPQLEQKQSRAMSCSGKERRQTNKLAFLLISKLEGWLSARKECPIANLGAPVGGVVAMPELASELRLGRNHVRRQKDAVELDRMRAAERAMQAGLGYLHARLPRPIRARSAARAD
jgi:hypothetical protein